MEVKYSKASLKFLAKSDKATVNRIRIEPKKITEASYEITITTSDIFEQIILNKRKRGIHTGN